MITLGDSYYLRYNNPIEAEQMRSAMGNRMLVGGEFEEKDETAMLDYFYETNINPMRRRKSQDEGNGGGGWDKTYNNLKPLDINGWQCPKVFSADLVTVNMPAKDVLGQKYANFAKNLAENHRKDKNINTKHSEELFNNVPQQAGIRLNDSMEFLSKVQNTSTPQKSNAGEKGTSFDSSDYLEDMLKICTEYAERQERSSGSLSSSPIVQNRIKTNGSLPREKKSPFPKTSNELVMGSPQAKSSGYENVRIVAQESTGGGGYENVRYVPQSPRTKIRTNCLSSPKKEMSAPFAGQEEKTATLNYEDLIKNFEEKFQKEIEAIEQSSRNVSKTLSANNTPLGSRRTNKNINNLTIDIKSLVSPHNSPKLAKKAPTPAPRNLMKPPTKPSSNSRGSLNSLKNKNPEQEKLHNEREDLLRRLNHLKEEISVLQQQDNEALIEMDMENALVLGELQSLNETKHRLEKEYKSLQQRVHRLEAQRNATRVMEENQQAKLKQSIEMKEDQMAKLKEMLKQKPDNPCLKEELSNVCESLENDRRAFEDLEFQYLEGESDWQAQCEELHEQESDLQKQIDHTKKAIENIHQQQETTTTTSSESQTQLRKRLVQLLSDLQDCEQKFKDLEEKLAVQLATNQKSSSGGGSTHSIMSQSLFGSTEILSSKRREPNAANNEDLMSKSFNENMFYNNKIEIPQNSLRMLNRSSREMSQESVVVVDRDEVDEVKSSKEASNKILESIKEIERNRKLLASKQEQRALEKEREKIEEILKALNNEPQKYLTVRGGGGDVPNNSFKENKENLKQKRLSIGTIERQVSEPPQQKSSLQAAFEKQNSAPSNFQRPLSESNSETADDLLMTPGPQRKSFGENPSLRTTSPDSPRSTSLEKRSSSVLSSNEGGSEKRKLQLGKHQRPLTRYMPIFAQDLDLRRHIHSAGHQLDLCPHLHIDELSCRGYLHKLGSTFHTWSKRWFVFDRQRNAFIYYSDKSERKPRGGAYFSSIDEVYMDHLNASKSSRPHCTFIVKTKKRKYYLQAASDAAARIWIDVIITGAQGNIDY
ncbi:pleckstrin homology-like domain family B member 2 [Musca vetustissima]|uniref:pleckstrin homology-like domain family B member 2 n=1 Tax=Musca vetustissima TaxID=27455 RepID=UPI002AB68730|nr:pleckstrin homology-like domain family B member 2 [Musca vetustissima]